MDGTTDCGDDRVYSRAPELEDLVELCRSLNESRELLIQTKQTIRPHDAADVAFLRRLEELL